ncbi:MAG: PAS domain S-box protein [Chitinophagales bacterium]
MVEKQEDWTVSEDILDLFTDGFIILDCDWRFTFINKTAGRYFPVPREELLGQVIWDTFPSLINTTVYTGLHSPRIHQMPTHFTLDTINGVSFDISTKPEKSSLMVCFHENTGCQHPEEISSQTIRTLLPVFHQNPIPMVICRASDYVIIEVNENLCSNTEYSRIELVGKTPQTIGIFPNLDRLNCALKSLASGSPLRDHEAIYITKLGLQRTVLISASKVFLTEPCFLFTIIDITDRKILEKRYRDSKELFETSIESLVSCFTILTARRNPVGKIIDLEIQYCNQAAVSSIGKDRNSVPRLLSELIPGLLDLKIFAMYCDVINTGRPLMLESFPYDTNVWVEKGGAFDLQAVKLGDGLVISWSDVSARYQAEKSLRTSEDRFSKTFHWSPVAMVIVRLSDLKVLDINEQCIALTGYSYEELAIKNGPGAELLTKMHGVVEMLPSMKEGLSYKELDVEFQTKSGSQRIARASIATLIIEEELCALLTFQDITEQKASEERFWKAFQLSPVAMAIARASDSTCIDVNQRALELSGYTREEVMGRSPGDLGLYLSDELRLKLLNRVANHQSIHDVETCFRVKNGKEYVSIFSVELISLGGELCLLAAFQDITERKQLEDKLRSSKERFETSIENLVDCFVILSALRNNTGEITDFRLDYINQAACQYLHAKKEMVSHSLSELIGGFINDKFFHQCCQVVDTGQAFIAESWSYANPLEPYVSGIYDVQATRLDDGLVISWRDVSGREEAAEALRASEERFYKAFHKSPLSMSIARNSDGVYLDVNEQWSAVTGYSREEAIGKNAGDFNLYRNLERIDMLEMYMKTGQEIRDVEIEFRVKSNAIRTVSLSIEQITLNGESCRLNVFKDITKSKELEQNLARLDRLNLVGETAASMGHEIRNPITIVRGFLQLFLEDSKIQEHHNEIELMIEELDRSSNIISEFLLLAKNKAIELKHQDLNMAIIALNPLIRADAASRDMSILVSLEEIPELALDQQEIRQLILNLTRNGLEAMSPGGVLTMTTRLLQNEVVLSVRDEGSGIPPEIISRLGTPFLSTKDNGVGLGLAVCYSVAARHNATLDFDTGPNGTTFNVHFKLPN